jgi:hypothetical protein
MKSAFYREFEVFMECGSMAAAFLHLMVGPEGPEVISQKW